MIGRMPLKGLVVAAIASLPFVTGFGPAAAVGGPPSPAPGSTPSAPSAVTLDLSGAITWQDNSDNEDGFRIV